MLRTDWNTFLGKVQQSVQQDLCPESKPRNYEFIEFEMTTVYWNCPMSTAFCIWPLRRRKSQWRSNYRRWCISAFCHYSTSRQNASSAICHKCGHNANRLTTDMRSAMRLNPTDHRLFTISAKMRPKHISNSLSERVLLEAARSGWRMFLAAPSEARTSLTEVSLIGR